MNITYAKYVNQIGILTTTASASFLNIKIDDGDLMSVPISTDNIPVSYTHLRAHET